MRGGYWQLLRAIPKLRLRLPPVKLDAETHASNRRVTEYYHNMENAAGFSARGQSYCFCNGTNMCGRQAVFFCVW